MRSLKELQYLTNIKNYQKYFFGNLELYKGNTTEQNRVKERIMGTTLCAVLL